MENVNVVLTVSVIYVDNSELQSKGWKSMTLLEKHTMHTLIWNLVIKTKLGFHILFSNLLLRLIFSGALWSSNGFAWANKLCERCYVCYESVISASLQDMTLPPKKQTLNPIFQLGEVPNSTEIPVPIFLNFKYCHEFLFHVRSRRYDWSLFRRYFWN